MTETIETRTAQAYRFGAFVLDTRDERLFGPQGPVPLGRRAYGVLLALLENNGRLVTKAMLFDTVWDDVIVSDYALTSVVKELRRALGNERGRGGLIETVYGRGYRFAAEVREVATTDAPSHRVVAKAEPGPQPEPHPAADQPAKNDTATAIPIGLPPLLLVPEFDDSALGDEQPAFAPVLREQVLLALSRFRDVRVIPENFSSPAGDEGDGAFGPRGYCLEVMLTPGASDPHLYLRVKRLHNESIIWSDQVEAEGGDVHTIVEGLAQRIVGAIIPLIEGDLRKTAPARPVDLHDRYYRLAQEHSDPRDKPEVKIAIEKWKGMIGENPDFLPPYLKLIRLLNTDGKYVALGLTGTEERVTARSLAETAYALDPTDSVVHVQLGWCLLWGFEWKKADRHFDEAVRLNPYNTKRLAMAATGIMYGGDLKKASGILEMARSRLAAFATDDLLEDTGLLCLLKGDFTAAEDNLSLIDHPTISADLFRVLSARARDAENSAELAGKWIARVNAAWHDGTAPDREDVLAWIARHHPFQAKEQRAEMLGIARAALNAAVQAPTDRKA